MIGMERAINHAPKTPITLDLEVGVAERSANVQLTVAERVNGDRVSPLTGGVRSTRSPQPRQSSRA